MRFHLFINLICISSSILEKLMNELRGTFVGQRAYYILRSKNIARQLTNENPQNNKYFFSALRVRKANVHAKWKQYTQSVLY